MRIRRLLLGLAVSILATGLFLFAITTVRETHSSSSSSYSNGPYFGFTYSGETLTPDNPPQVIVGTTGVGDLIILRTPFRDFSSWVCHQLGSGDCAYFGGGNDFNITILNSYLQTHQSQIAYSRTIVDENVTLDYRVTTPTDVTIVLADLGSSWTRDYWQSTMTNQTLTYPLIGYTERPGTTWNLANISLVFVAVGTASLLAILMGFKAESTFKAESPRKAKVYQIPAMQICLECGHENLFYAEKCLHCGSILHNAKFRVEVPPQAT